MKAPLASMALAFSFSLALSASAQQAGNPGPTAPNFTPTPGSGTKGSALSRSMGSLFGSKGDPNVVRSETVVPEPVPMGELEAPKIPLPERIDERFLLQKENGPFMISAYSFVGPDAAKYAQLLVMELRKDYKLPAYIWYARVTPGRSYIQRVQPHAADFVRNGDMAPPESYREKDEAVVLVGDCKTLAEAAVLLKQVKPIKPVCLTQLPSIYIHRKEKGLFRALITTNPFQATQNLFPGRGPVPGMPLKNGEKFDPNLAATSYAEARVVEPFVRSMNRGKNSLFKNPSEYTLIVGVFGGRATIAYANQNVIVNRKVLEQSPLMTAHEDAELLAEALAKCATLKGYRPYVFHTRAASYVTLGGFKSESDPAVKALRDLMPNVRNELIVRQLSMDMPLPTAKLMYVPRDH